METLTYDQNTPKPTAIAWIEAEPLALQQQLFAQWHRYKDGTIAWNQIQQSCRPIRQHFEGTLQDCFCFQYWQRKPVLAPFYMGRLRFELRTNRLKAECSTAELATRRPPNNDRSKPA